MSENIVESQWGSAEDIKRIFGITRGTLYKLAGAGRIKSTLFKTKPDARKGVRLFSIQSIREFLEANVISS